MARSWPSTRADTPRSRWTSVRCSGPAPGICWRCGYTAGRGAARGWLGPAAISCDTELPHKPVDYWPYAGITRGVFIEATAQVTVSKLITRARRGRLAAAAVVFNHGAGPARRRLILDPGEGTGGAPVSRDLAPAPGEGRVVTAHL